MKISFKVRCDDCVPPNRLFVVGHSGSWSVEEAGVELTKRDGLFWTTEPVPFHQSGPFAYKYIIKRVDGGVDWEAGDNRRVDTLPLDAPLKNVVVCDVKFGETWTPCSVTSVVAPVPAQASTRPLDAVAVEDSDDTSVSTPVVAAVGVVSSPVEAAVDDNEGPKSSEPFVVSSPSPPPPSSSSEFIVPPPPSSSSEFIVPPPPSSSSEFIVQQPLASGRAPTPAESAQDGFEERARFSVGGARVAALSFHPLLQRILAAHENGVDVFDFFYGDGPAHLVQQVKSKSPVTVAQFHPSANPAMFVAGSQDGELRFFRDDNQTPWSLRTEAGGAISAISFHGSQPWLVSASGSGSMVGMFSLWNWTTRKLLFSFAGHDGPIRSLAFHPSRALMASGGEDHTVRIWRFDEFAAKQGALAPIYSASLLGPVPHHTTTPPAPLAKSDFRIASVLSAADGDGHVAPVTWVGFASAEPRALFSSGLDCSLRATELVGQDYDIDMIHTHRLNLRPIRFSGGVVIAGLDVDGTGTMLIYADDDYVCALDTSLGGGSNVDAAQGAAEAALLLSPSDLARASTLVDDYDDEDDFLADAGVDGAPDDHHLHRIRLGAALDGQCSLSALAAHRTQPLFAIGTAEGKVVVHQARPSLSHMALVKRACKFNMSAGLWVARVDPSFDTQRAFDLLADHCEFRSGVGRNFTLSWNFRDREFRAVSRVSGADVRLRVGNLGDANNRSYRVMRARFLPAHAAEVRELLTFFSVETLSPERILVGSGSSGSKLSRRSVQPSVSKSTSVGGCTIQ